MSTQYTRKSPQGEITHQTVLSDDYLTVKQSLLSDDETMQYFKLVEEKFDSFTLQAIPRKGSILLTGSEITYTRL